MNDTRLKVSSNDDEINRLPVLLGGLHLNSIINFMKTAMALYKKRLLLARLSPVTDLHAALTQPSKAMRTPAIVNEKRYKGLLKRYSQKMIRRPEENMRKRVKTDARLKR